MASLLTGTALSSPMVQALSDPGQLDALAQDLAPEREGVAVGLQARVQQLSAMQSIDDGALALSSEAVDLLAPLAERMGMARWRAQLEDASFRVSEPDSHADLQRLLAHDPAADAARILQLKAETEGLLQDLGLQGTVSARVKSLYSLHRKMQRKGVPLEAVVDRLALRVQVNEIEDCYAVFDAARSRYRVLEHETDDYIASPKANGYRSLHTALVAPDGAEPFELQVRTHAMHARAEGGEAAHWRYKLGA